MICREPVLEANLEIARFANCSVGKRQVLLATPYWAPWLLLL